VLTGASKGSVGAAMAQAAFQVAFFAKASIPDLDKQMSEKYKGQWQEYKRQVPYALIPGVY
jgi:protein-S-isoprenylcysteine O-methyltransferase Ste14